MDTVNDDDQEGWEQSLSKTGFICSYSEDDIAFDEPVVAFRVAVASLKDGLFFADHPVTSDGQHLLYDPVFMAADSWDEVNDSLVALVEDTNGVADPHGICECGYCKSDIRAGELFLLATLGEIQFSQRMPEGVRSPTFVDKDDSPTYYCLTCSVTLFEEVHALWSDCIKQNNECLEGTKNRCWRHGCPANEEQGCDLTRRTHLSILPT